MIINERLNLVVPLYHGDDVYAYVHAQPLSREVFEANYLLISRTFSAIHSEGLGNIAGPRVARMVMKTVAEQQKNEDSAQALINEIRRLSSVVLPSEGGWTTLPLQDALNQKKLDEDDVEEVENAITFFICASAMYRKVTLRVMLDGATKLWGAQISSLTCMAFVASLPISTAAVNTGGTVPPPPSSQPSLIG